MSHAILNFLHKSQRILNSYEINMRIFSIFISFDFFVYKDFTYEITTVKWIATIFY